MARVRLLAPPSLHSIARASLAVFSSCRGYRCGYFLARLVQKGFAIRVLVRAVATLSEDERRGVVPEGALDDLAREDAGLRQRALKQLLGRDHAVLGVEQYCHEHLAVAVRQRQAQVASQMVAHRPGAGERLAGGDLLVERPVREFERRLELGGLGRPHTSRLRDGTLVGREQAVERAELLDQVAPEVDGALALRAHAQKDREQLGVRQAPGAALEQLLPRALTRRPACNAHVYLPDRRATSRRILRTL